jgi:5-methylcytosine-specific restriction enzyme A
MSLRGHQRQEFPQAVRKAAFLRCCRNGIPHCEGCGNVLRSGGIIYEHVQPDGLSGEPTLSNCKVYCKVCADKKTFTEDNPRMQKADRVLKAAYGLKRKTRPMPGSRASGIRKRMDGTVEKRS